MSSPSQHPHHHLHLAYYQDTLGSLLGLENDLAQGEETPTGQASDQQRLPQHYDDLDFAADLLPDFVYDHTLEFDFDEQRPSQNSSAAANAAFSSDRPLLAPFFLLQNPRHDFTHLRNISLDDLENGPFRRSNHQHLASLVSNAADPPLGTFAHSYLSVTLHLLAELVPQLLLLVLNPLLLDLPHLGLQTATPGRRHKSTSVLSHTNLYTTPMRGTASPLAHSKVGKTPHLAMGKTHRRNRLRASLDPALASAHLLATVATMKNSGQGSSGNPGNSGISSGSGYASVAQTPGGYPSQQFSINLNEANPFHAGFVLPSVHHGASDLDATPLNTPAPKGNHGLNSQYFTPITHNQSFGGLLLDLLALVMPLTLSLNDLSLTSSSNQLTALGMATLRRNDTLDSIKIEDQEDDACKQLRKAKSFTSFADQNSKMARIVNLRNRGSTEFYHESASEVSASGSPPKYPRDQHPQDALKRSASIDMLLPDLVVPDRTGNTSLKSFPASIDLAAISHSSSGSHASPLPPLGSRLMPPMAALASMPSGSRGSSYSRLSLANTAAKKLGQKVPAGYPTASQIQKASTTEDIAKFAESILQSDSKRPIYVQRDQDDVDDPKKKHKCPLCLARFQRPEHVKRHLKSHSTEKPFQCDEPNCGRRFNRKDNLKAHLKKIHKKVV